MTELRLNVLTDEWVIIAPTRALRPSDLAQTPRAINRPRHSPDCPFCPGNEHASEERDRRVDPSGDGWITRTVWNKYPALSPTTEPPRHRDEGWQVSVDAHGTHEVMIESPRHDLPLALLPKEQVVEVVHTYRDRYRVLAADPYIRHVLIFRNHGESAGISLVHPHSQIVAMPVIPSQIRARLAVLAQHRARRGSCLICEMLADELESGERVVYEGEHFVAFIPYAALSPFHTWIFPKRRMRSFGEVDDDELVDLAGVLSRVVRMLHVGLGDPDFNLVIRSAPNLDREAGHDDESFHWYLAIVPRLSRAAGFELGTGMFINSAYPRESAAFLRDVDVSSLDD